MTKPSFESMEGLEQIDDAPEYSKDFWDLVFEQLGKRALFKVGMVLLALMYAVAIYAPFLANDRPYRFEGVDIGGYNGALRQLVSIPSVMTGKVRMSDEEFRKELEVAGTLGDAKKTPQTRGDSLAAEAETVHDRVSLMLGYLPEDAVQLRETLSALPKAIDEAVAAFQAGNAEKATEILRDVKKDARALRDTAKPLDRKEPGAGGVDLVARMERPLWDDIPPLDVFFMVLWLWVLAWPIWNPLFNRLLGRNRERIRHWRMRKTGMVLGTSALAALVWFGVFGAGGKQDANAPYKADLQNGNRIAIQAGSRLSDTGNEFQVTWAPINYGVAESHLAEQFRPPTWLSQAESTEGSWVPGAADKSKKAAEASPGAQDAPKELAGDKKGDEFQATYKEVEIRESEPGIDDWDRHIAGTDETGRDFFTRMIWGARTSLTVGILSAVLLTLIGIFFGALAGYFGGWVDVLIMRLIEVLQSIPAFYLILLTVVFIPPDTIKPIFAIVIVIALIRWTGTARLVRGEFMRLREAEFVVAARALGFSDLRTMFRHVLPNAMSPGAVSAAFLLPRAS
ncbi:MAG: ABC transporter permease [Planctomycetota bacterium]